LISKQGSTSPVIVSSRTKRNLRTKDPKIYPLKTPDGVSLRLTRYEGGTKGPVLILHGMAVTTFMWKIDTIDTNVTEFLYENGYDIWLLDWRASIDLESSLTQFTLDDVGKYDVPTAVSRILEETKLKSLAIFSHCLGALSTCIAILGGHLPKDSVHSLVLSQVGMNMVGGTWNSIKTFVHLVKVFEKLGINKMNMHDSSTFPFPRITQAISEECLADQWCSNTTCQQSTFFFGCLWDHKNLNENTHNICDEMLGYANLTTMGQCSLICGSGILVNASGEKVYATEENIRKYLNIPICFIHGEDNMVFKHIGTQHDVEMLKKVNKDQKYKQVLIKSYGHLDCLIGKNASKDVYPFILQHLEETPRP